eukprot:7460188-Pyramimonas_sp.AAC.1
MTRRAGPAPGRSLLQTWLGARWWPSTAAPRRCADCKTPGRSSVPSWATWAPAWREQAWPGPPGARARASPSRPPGAQTSSKPGAICPADAFSCQTLVPYL